MSPGEMADFEEHVIHADDGHAANEGLNISAGDEARVTTSGDDGGDRLTKSGRIKLVDVQEATGKSGTRARRPRRKVT